MAIGGTARPASSWPATGWAWQRPRVEPRANPNAVQLGSRCSGDTGPWRTGRLRPGPVMSPLYVPLDVLALYDPRVAALTPLRVEPSHEQGDCVAPAALSVLRGKNRAPL